MKKAAVKLGEFLEAGGVKKEIVFLILSGISLILSLCKMNPFPFDIAWVSIILCGIPIILEAVIGLITEFDIKADVLVSMALVASVCIGEDFAAGEVAFIMQLGALLEDMTVAKAREGIEKLVRLTPQTARVVKEKAEQVIPAEQVHVGDLIRVLPGETIPVDGMIIEGQTSVNQAVMTGESLPVDKGTGDMVASGTINQFGAFIMQAEKVGADSSIQRMIQLVQSADAGKAKIVGIADRWATWIVVIALAAAAVTWLLSGEIIRAVTILVVFCPCALVLATPTAIMAAIGNATKHGFLVREGDALERLAQTKKIAFDKTGTLTYGVPAVTAVRSYSDTISEEKLFLYTASAERFSEHPLGKAIVSSYWQKKGLGLRSAEQFSMLPGQGITAVVEEKMVVAGNETLLKEEGIVIAQTAKDDVSVYLDQGCTVVYVSVDGSFAGFIALSDTLRRESRKMVAELEKTGITPVLLTGDNKKSAGAIARQLCIREVVSDCMPEDKLKKISQYQSGGCAVCMLGDGINDAPALKKADVGIAMGGIGSDIAVDAADIALVSDEIKELPHLLELSKRMMRTIKINLSFSMGLNFLAIALAITGVLNPVVGALVHNAGSVFVIIHSALLLKWRDQK